MSFRMGSSVWALSFREFLRTRHRERSEAIQFFGTFWLSGLPRLRLAVTGWRVLIFAVALLLPITAFACKCAGIDPKEAYQKADLVLVAKQNLEECKPSFENLPVIFNIKSFVKGAVRSDPLEIIVDRASDVHLMCQGFNSGDCKNAYLVFLVNKGDGYSFMSDCYASSFVVKDDIVDMRSEKIPLAKLKDWLSSK